MTFAQEYIRNLAKSIRDNGYTEATKDIPDHDAALMSTPLGINTLMVDLRDNGGCVYVSFDGLTWAYPENGEMVEERFNINQPLTVKAFNDGVTQLAQSSRDLAARFGQQRTVDGQIALVREELAEVLAATDDAHRVEELCDLCVVCSGYNDTFEALKAPNVRHYYDFDPYPNFTLQERLNKATVDVNPIDMLHIYDYLLTIPNAAELFPAAVAAVVAKNAAKSDATHELNAVTGKITQKAATT